MIELACGSIYVSEEKADDVPSIHDVAISGSADDFLTHVAARTNLNASRASDFKKPLHLAVINGHTHIVNKLIRHGADLYAIDDDYNLPIFYAVTTMNDELFNMMVSKYDHLDHKNKKGLTLFQVAMRTENEHVVKEMIRLNKNIDSKDLDGVSALAYAVRNDMATIVHYMCQLSWHPHLVFHDACRRGSVATVKKLLEDHTVSFLTFDRDGFLPIHMSAANGHVDVVSALIEAGCDPNLTTKNGHSAFHMAVGRAHFHLLAYLLTLPTLKTDGVSYRGFTAMETAKMLDKEHRKKMITLLATHGIGKHKKKNRFIFF